MMKYMTQRLPYFIGFIVITALLGFGEYLEIYKGITPCPLCSLQRIALGLLGITFLFGMAFSAIKFGRIFISLLGFMISLLGILLSGRQVWLQHVPSTVTGNCDVSLNYMIKVLPFDQVLAKIYEGGSTCSKIEWQFLNLSIAEWSLIWFVIFALFSIYQLFRK